MEPLAAEPLRRSRRAVLHIGTHKTGTTSIQRYLQDRLGQPAFPEGYFFEANHGALAHAVARPGRLVSSQSPREPALLAEIAGIPDRVRADIGRADDLVVFSGEALSMLRHPDEVERVVELFSDCELEVVVYTRRPEDFLRSYRQSIAIWGDQPSDDPDSKRYLGSDSWLVRYSERIDLWRRYAPVVHIDYDEVVARDGSVIPSFAALLGLDPVEYRLNVSAENRALLFGGPSGAPE